MGHLVNESIDYTCHIVRCTALDDPTRRALCDLYLSSYEATTPELFHGDLLGKDEVLLLHAGARLVGFTTLRVFDAAWRGQAIRVVFSGDTVVERAHWGQQSLSQHWLRRMGQIKRDQPDKRLVWLLLVKGHRTYRYLHVFAKTFHPRPAQHLGQDLGHGSDQGADLDACLGDCDSDLAALADHLARQQWPGDYRPISGVVEFVPSRGQLKQDLADPRPDELLRPGVAYFLQRNPGYRRGHELVCVCDVEEANMKPMTLRLFRQGLHDTSPAP
jgi:hypothetical protein